MITARDLISGQELNVVSSRHTILEAARLMTEKRIGAVPVVEGENLVGIFSERDIMTRVVAKDIDYRTTPVESVMSRNLIVGRPDESIERILARMKQSRIRHLPIVNEGTLIGILSLRDLLQADILEKDEEIRIMTAYIQYVPPLPEG